MIRQTLFDLKERILALSLLVWAIPVSGEPGDTLWTYTLSSGGKIFSAAGIDEAGNIYFGAEDGKFYSLDSSGALRWTYTGAQDWIDSAPALTADGGVVFGSWEGRVFCLDRATGVRRWRYPADFSTIGAVVGSPAVAEDGSIYFGSFDGLVYGLTPQGELDWFYVSDAEVESSIALDAEGNLYFGDSAGTLHSLDPDGSLRWRVELPPYARDGVLDFEIIASIALGLDDEVYVASRAGDLLQIDSVDGMVSWAFPMSDWIDSPPIIRTDGSIIVTDRSGLMACVSRDGYERWSLNVGEVLYAAPVVDEHDNVYVVGYVGGGQSQLSCVRRRGDLAWSEMIGGIHDSSLSLDNGGNLLFGLHEGIFLAIEGSGFDLNPYSIWPRFKGDRMQTGRRRTAAALPDASLTVSVVNGETLLSWVGAGVSLYESTDPASGWSYVDDQTPEQTLPTPLAPRFYQLQP